MHKRLEPPARSGYLYSLDGWRAIAVVAVMLCHDDVHRMGAISTEWIHRYGEHGVDLFFAISGILICSRLLSEEAQFGRISLRGFYTRRIFRIQPAALVYLAVVGGLAFSHQFPLSPGALISPLLCFRNFFPLHGGLSAATELTNHFWSLSLEEQFYLILPAFLVLFRKWRVRLMSIAIVALLLWSFAYGKGNFTPFGPFPWWRTDLRMSSLLVPALMAVLLSRPAVAHSAKRWINPFSAAAVSVLFFALLAWKMNAISAFLTNTITYPLLVLGTMLHPKSIPTRILEWQPIKFVGRISYSLYLWQQLFISAMVNLPARSGWATLSQHWPLRYLCLFSAAIITYYCLERPLIRLGHRLAPPATEGRDDLAAGGPKALPSLQAVVE